MIQRKAPKKPSPKQAPGKKTHTKAAVCFFVVSLLIGGAFITFGPRIYMSDAKLYLRMGRESVGLDPTAATIKGSAAVSISDARQYEISSVVDMLQNRAIIASVVDELGPPVILGDVDPVILDEANEESVVDADHNWTRVPLEIASVTVSRLGANVVSFLRLDPLTDRERAIRYVEDDLRVAAGRRSSVITVEYQSTSPLLSQVVVDSLVRQFLEAHPTWSRAEGSTTFFEEQVQLLDKTVRQAHSEFASAKNELHLASVEGHRDQLNNQLSEIETALMTAEREFSAFTHKAQALEEARDARDPRVVTEVLSGIADGGRDAMRSQLYDLELEERDLASRFRNDYPPLVAVRQQIARASNLLEDSRDERTNTTTAPNPIRLATEEALALHLPEVAATAATVEQLRDQHLAICQRIDEFNDKDVQLAALQRKLDLAASAYQAYAQGLEQSRVDHALKNSMISNVNVVQPAAFRPEAVYPREALMLLACLFVSVAGAVLIAWLPNLRAPARVSDFERSLQPAVPVESSI